MGCFGTNCQLESKKFKLHQIWGFSKLHLIFDLFRQIKCRTQTQRERVSLDPELKFRAHPEQWRLLSDMCLTRSSTCSASTNRDGQKIASCHVCEEQLLETNVRKNEWLTRKLLLINQHFVNLAQGAHSVSANTRKDSLKRRLHLCFLVLPDVHLSAHSLAKWRAVFRCSCLNKNPSSLLYTLLTQSEIDFQFNNIWSPPMGVSQIDRSSFENHA